MKTGTGRWIGTETIIKIEYYVIINISLINCILFVLKYPKVSYVCAIFSYSNNIH